MGIVHCQDRVVEGTVTVLFHLWTGCWIWVEISAEGNVYFNLLDTPRCPGTLSAMGQIQGTVSCGWLDEVQRCVRFQPDRLDRARKIDPWSHDGPFLEDLLIYMGPNDWFTDNSNGLRPIKSIILGMYNPWLGWTSAEAWSDSLLKPELAARGPGLPQWAATGSGLKTGSTMSKERPCSTSHHPDFWAPWILPIIMERIRQNPWDVFCGSVMIGIHYQLCVLLRPERDGQVVKFDKVCAQDGVLVPSPVTTV